MPSSIPISHIPTTPWVYIFKDQKDSILYIGKAKNLLKRVQQYFAPWSVWKQDMLNHARSVEYLTVKTESEALFLEENLIKKHLPPYNRLLKSQSSYVYLKITNHAFPQIFLTRRRRDDGALYIWPKNNAQALRKLLQFFRQFLKYRGCRPTQFKQGVLCSDYLFGICAWRCVFEKLKSKKNTQAIQHYLAHKNDDSSQKKRLFDDKVQQAMAMGISLTGDYEHYHQQSQQVISQIVSFFQWNVAPISQALHEHMQHAIEQEHFERAARLRDIIYNIDAWTEKQHVVLDPHLRRAFVLIKKVGQYYVYVVVSFFDGRMVDIVRDREHEDDMSLNQLITAIQTTFASDIDFFDISRKKWETYNHTWDDQQKKAWLLARADQQVQTRGLLGIQQAPAGKKRLLKKAIKEEVLGLMEGFMENFIVAWSFENNSIMSDLLADIQHTYHIKHYPYHIECLDISHLSGGWTSGGLSCFQWGISYKKGYRHYKIRSKNASDDYIALREVIIRRFALNKKESPDTVPDLFILDGWKGQLGIVTQLIQEELIPADLLEKVQFASLGKGDARHAGSKTYGAQETLFVLDKHYRIQETSLTYDQADQLLVKIRDEAHRFANRYRKKQMSKERKR